MTKSEKGTGYHTQLSSGTETSHWRSQGTDVSIQPETR